MKNVLRLSAVALLAASSAIAFAGNDNVSVQIGGDPKPDRIDHPENVHIDLKIGHVRSTAIGRNASVEVSVSANGGSLVQRAQTGGGEVTIGDIPPIRVCIGSRCESVGEDIGAEAKADE